MKTFYAGRIFVVYKNLVEKNFLFASHSCWLALSPSFFQYLIEHYSTKITLFLFIEFVIRYTNIFFLLFLLENLYIEVYKHPR